MTAVSKWTRVCAGCGVETDDWGTHVPSWSTDRRPVPLCWQCEQREQDHRREKD